MTTNSAPSAGAAWAGHAAPNVGGSRATVERVVVEGLLVLLEPAHLGAGVDGLADLPLLTDPLDGRSPLLPGSTLAGLLRAGLRARQHGHRAAPAAVGPDDPEVLLFGGTHADDDGPQSPLIVEDALGTAPPDRPLELRDGVAIDPATRTADDDKLFQFEAWAAGTAFPLRLELLVGEYDDRDALATALVAALEPLARGHFALGARTRRGYGRARVERWRVRRYRLSDPADLLAWLGADAASNTTLADDPQAVDATGPDALARALGASPDRLPDRRRAFHLEATFALDAPLLVRASDGDVGSPDAVHLHGRSASGDVVPVLSGTSLAGALRARARTIVRTLGLDPDAVVPPLFGAPPDTDRPVASRLSVREAVVEGAEDRLVQTRVAIDRLTGGTLPGLLFEEQPAFPRDGTALTVSATLESPEPHEVGLLLLLLKDLWTADLAVGGSRSVGRGRLRGQTARLRLQTPDAPRTWALHAAPDGSLTGDRDGLEPFVQALADGPAPPPAP